MLGFVLHRDDSQALLRQSHHFKANAPRVRLLLEVNDRPVYS